MAWTVIAHLVRDDGSTEVRHARTFDTQLAALKYLAILEVSWADPRIEIVLEEGGPFQYIAVPCLICGGDINVYDHRGLRSFGRRAGIICPECARWAVAVEAKMNRWRRPFRSSCAVEIAAQQERRARL